MAEIKDTRNPYGKIIFIHWTIGKSMAINIPIRQTTNKGSGGAFFMLRMMMIYRKTFFRVHIFF